MSEHYPVKAGYLGSRYVIAKLGTMRKEREWLVQPTSDDRIIVQGSKPDRPGKPSSYPDAIGIFDAAGGKNGRLCTRGGFFPHLAIARAFDFPPEFVRTCLDISQPLDSETTQGGCTVAHTVQVIS